MKVFKSVLIVLVAFAVLATAGVYSGIFNFAADDPHWGFTVRLVESARERSIVSHSKDIVAPEDLQDARLIANGAGEYAEMCTECHLAPGMKDTEMRTGLYPKPPNLAEPGAQRTAAQQFWIIKHGLKMSGMPAWGLTHDDDRIWSIVAFLQKLPDLSPVAYRELAESGEGGHHHDAADGDEHAAGPEKMPAITAGATATVDRFQSLLATGDTSEAARILDAMVLIYESGDAERSREEYASHHLQADASFLKDANVRVLSRTGNASGDLAWIATESEIRKAGSKPVSLIATETMVLKREAQTWHIAHIHWSSRAK